MNGEEALRRLYKERKSWRTDYKPANEILWTIRGLTLAINHVKDMMREIREKQLLRKPKINKWCAGDLFHAICSALKCLSRAERSRAIAILENAKEKAIKDVTL